MLLDLPLTRPTAAPPALWATSSSWAGPAAWLRRAVEARRTKRATQAAAVRLARTDAATGLAERRVATLWLHASAGIAQRKGERLALALVRAERATPAEVAQAVAKALPVGGMAARWDAGTYLVAAPGAEGATLWLALRAELAKAGLVAEVGWAGGTDPDQMLEGARRALEAERHEAPHPAPVAA